MSSGLPLRMPPGTARHLRLSEDLAQQRRQWVHVWLGAVFVPLVLVGALISAFQPEPPGHDQTRNTVMWLLTAVVVLLVSAAGTLRPRNRLTLPLLCAFVMATSVVGAWHSPQSFGPIGGLAAVIGLISLTESATNILVAGVAVIVAAVVPLLIPHREMSESLPVGLDATSRVGTLIVLTTLAYVGSRSSTRVLDELRDNISDNEAMAAVLTENLANLEATVDERTRSLAERTADLEAINADLDRAVDEQTALAEQFRHKSLHDELTGLVNRRGFMQALAAADNAGGWIVMADLDHFKVVNDTWGHPVGDDALRRFAAVLTGLIPASALGARVGGEEFAVVLPAKDRAGVEDLMQRLLHEVRRMEVPGMRGHGLTVSLGAADIADPAGDAPPRDGEHRRACLEALRRADRALYTAKSSGRDRSVLFADRSPSLTPHAAPGVEG